LFVYYFYAHFFTHGIKSFIEIFPSIISIVNDHWEILRPFNRKDKQVESSLNWLLSLTINKLKYCEKLHRTGKTHPIWEKSVNETSKEELEQLVTISIEFKNFFFDKWPKSPLKERLMHLLKRFEELKALALIESNKIDQEDEEEEAPHTIAQEVQEPVSSEQNEEQEIHEEVESSDGFMEPAQEVQLKEEVPESKEEEVQQMVSKTTNEEFFEEMDILSHKLKVFERLIEKNEYAKAALVAKDINHLIENFDPLIYFPKLFSNYFSLLARHVLALSEQWEDKSLKFKYLEKLYQTDLNKFIEW
jgi:hypothetical protein